PVSIHLAESADEVELCLHGRGALREMLDRFGAVPTDASGSGLHPVDWFCARLRSAPRGAGGAGRLAVHLNAFEAHHAAQLASLGVTAVICPRATAFFGRRGGAWRALRDAGVPVALGTDGRLCLDTPDRISTLDEIRCLARAGEVTLREGLA